MRGGRAGSGPDGRRAGRLLALSRLFRGKLCANLDETQRAGLLRFGGSTAALAAPTNFQAFLEEQRSKEWNVHAKRPFGSPEHVLKYLARYTHRVAISNSRILSMGEAGVTFRYRDNARGPRVMTLDGVELLRRFLLHVLPTGFVGVRYYGLLANRSREGNIKRCRALNAAEPAAPQSSAPAPAPKPVEERDRCPTCGIGRLRCVGVLSPVSTELDASAPRGWDTS